MKVNLREVSFLPAGGDIHQAVPVDIGQSDAVGAPGGIIDGMAVPGTTTCRLTCCNFSQSYDRDKDKQDEPVEYVSIFDSSHIHNDTFGPQKLFASQNSEIIILSIVSKIQMRNES
jgi:hypothetical protein